MIAFQRFMLQKQTHSNDNISLFLQFTPIPLLIQVKSISFCIILAFSFNFTEKPHHQQKIWNQFFCDFLKIASSTYSKKEILTTLWGNLQQKMLSLRRKLNQTLFDIYQKSYRNFIQNLYKSLMFNKIVRISYQFATHSKFCILGAGTGGINVAAQLLRQKNISGADIRIFDPSTYHYYQPGWTMVGNNLTSPENTRKPMEKVIPESTVWTKESIVRIDPAKNLILTDKGRQFTYDHLIVSTGFKNDWGKVKGLKELLDDPKSKVCSIYDYNYAQKTAKIGESFTGGKAIFTEPPLPIKCAGAPQKILYLWTDIWRQQNLDADIEFVKNAPVMFGVPKYSQALAKVANSYHITTTFKHNLIELTSNQAIFENLDTKEKVTKPYDFIHVVPPMSPHSFLKQSGITNQAGFVDVDKHTLRHTKFSNIWSLGDCSSLPNSKTAAAIFSQTQALIKNIVEVLNNPNAKSLPGKYDGYASCPLFVGKKELMLAEFKYDGVVDETFLNDQQKPRRVFYYMKKYLFPVMYWKVMPRGLWSGRKGINFNA